MIPNKKNNGQCLIYYLFGKGNIKVINYEQSLLINNIKNWENVEKLNKIFTNDKKQPLNSKIGELYLYLSSYDRNTEEDYKNKKKTDYCYW